MFYNLDQSTADPSRNPDVDMEILVKGNPIDVYGFKGNHYVEGRKGSEYSIRLRNKTHRRVCAILSVDGLSVMDGQPASEDSSGYLLDPWQSMEIPGWRVSNHEVASFTFNMRRSGYASRTNQRGNEGVIGLLVFREKQYVKAPLGGIVMEDPFRGMRFGGRRLGSSSGNITCNSVSTSALRATMQSTEVREKSKEREQDLATQFGRPQSHAVKQVSFERELVASQVSAIYYDSERGLERIGIHVRRPVEAQQPAAFPASGMYCKPPKNWERTFKR